MNLQSVPRGNHVIDDSSGWKADWQILQPRHMNSKYLRRLNYLCYQL